MIPNDDPFKRKLSSFIDSQANYQEENSDDFTNKLMEEFMMDFDVYRKKAITGELQNIVLIWNAIDLIFPYN